MSDGGKGSKPRPKSVDDQTFADNWDRIFPPTTHPDPDDVDGPSE